MFACSRSRSRIGSVERGGLAGSGLGGGEDVAAVEDEGDGRCLDRGGLGVALFRDGRSRSAERPSESKVKRCSCVDPAVAGGIRGSATAAPSRAAVGHRPHVGPSASIADIGPRPSARRCVRAPQCPVSRRSGRSMDLRRQAPSVPLAYSPTTPRSQPPDRQAQPKTRRPPRQDPCQPVEHRARRPPFRLTRTIARAIDRRAASTVRPTSRLVTHLPPAAPTTVTAPPRGVPAERRQGSCRFAPTAPSGRPPSGRVA